MEYQERVRARMERHAHQGLRGPNDPAAEREPTSPRESDQPAKKPQTIEEMERQSVENWLRYRREGAEQTPTRQGRSRDDDLSL
jgi:hypothetical protein